MLTIVREKTYVFNNPQTGMFHRLALLSTENRKIVYDFFDSEMWKTENPVTRIAAGYPAARGLVKRVLSTIFLFPQLDFFRNKETV
jgi:hypothetical protein